MPLACLLARSAASVGSGRLRGSDGPDRACLARLGSACDCVCLECVCVGRSPLKDRLRKFLECVCVGRSPLKDRLQLSPLKARLRKFIRE